MLLTVDAPRAHDTVCLFGIEKRTTSKTMTRLTGLAKSSCMPTAHISQPKYAGCRITLMQAAMASVEHWSREKVGHSVKVELLM